MDETGESLNIRKQTDHSPSHDQAHVHISLGSNSSKWPLRIGPVVAGLSKSNIRSLIWDSALSRNQIEQLGFDKLVRVPTLRSIYLDVGMRDRAAAKKWNDHLDYLALGDTSIRSKFCVRYDCHLASWGYLLIPLFRTSPQRRSAISFIPTIPYQPLAGVEQPRRGQIWNEILYRATMTEGQVGNTMKDRAIDAQRLMANLTLVSREFFVSHALDRSICCLPLLISNPIR